MAHGAFSRFKPSPAYAMHRSRVSPSSIVLSRPNPAYSHRNSLRIIAAHSRIRQCGYEPSSSYHCLSSNSPLRMKPSPILPSRAAPRLAVRSGKESKGKDSKGKKKGGKGGGGGGGGGRGSKGEATKRGGPRSNVWSKDIAETEYQASAGEAKPPRSKQQGQAAVASADRRDGDVRGKGGEDFGDDYTSSDEDFEIGYQDFGDDYTGVMATGGIPVETQEVLQAPVSPDFHFHISGESRKVIVALGPVLPWFLRLQLVVSPSSRDFGSNGQELCLSTYQYV